MTALTRRQFVTAVMTLPTLLALTESVPIDPDLTPGPAPAWPGSSERAAALDLWISRIDQALISLEYLWEILYHIRSIPPAEVDILALFRAVESASANADRFAYDVDHSDCHLDDLLTLVTGLPLDDIYALIPEVQL